MLKSETVCLNIGYYYSKGENNKSFLSAYQELDAHDYGCSGDIISFGGKRYAVGVGEPSLGIDRTTSIATKIFVLNMLVKSMSYTTEQHFNLLLTCPPVSFADQSESLPAYLKGYYVVEHSDFKEPRHIYIDNVQVFPETIMAYFANNPAKYQRPVIVIDVGGLTTNIAYIDKGTFNIDKISSEQYAMHHIEDEIRGKINRKYISKGISLNQNQMVNFLETGYVLPSTSKNLKDTEADIINKICTDFVATKIENTINIKRWGASTCDILVTGGGGKNLYPYIKNKYTHAQLSSDPIFDNLKGMQILSSQINKKRGA